MSQTSQFAIDTITPLLRDLVAIDSINPDLVPGAAGEAGMARYVADWLARAGLDIEIEEVAPGRPNVIGIARGSGGGRSLLFNAHMDTVGVAGMEKPHSPMIDGKRLYGRGAYDMKGGLAAAMVAVAQAKQQHLRGDVIITAVCDEEYASIGTEAIVTRWRADAAIVTEPTELQICVAHKGFVWLQVETQGIAAHGSRPELGVDAIVKMGHVLVALEKLDQELRANPTHKLLKSGSLHASLIGGGQELSSYPERCVVELERRTIPGETPDIVQGQIQAALDQIAATDPAFKATVKTTFVRDSFGITEDQPIFQLVNRFATQRIGQAPNVIGAPFWMDTAILSAAGIPCVAFGPCGTGAHAVVEWVDLESVAQCVEVLLETAIEFCR
jgi:acetylornithine deacetylase